MRPKDMWRLGDEGDRIETCSFCQREDPEGYYFIERAFGKPPGKPHQALLCEVCYKSWGGCAAEHPDSYEPVELYQMMAQCTNLVLRRIEEAEERILKEIKSGS